MPRTWDPEDILQLQSDSRCVGHAHTTGRKCRNIIRYDNLKRCNSILVEMSEQEPDSILLEPKLRRLAEHGLCVRWHQNQVDNMVQEWSSSIRAAFPPRTERRRIPYPASSSMVSDGLSSTVTSPTVSISDESEIETLQANIADMQESIRIAQHRLIQLLCARPTARASSTRDSSVSRVLTSDGWTLGVESDEEAASPPRLTQRRANIAPASRPVAPQVPSSVTRVLSPPRQRTPPREVSPPVPRAQAAPARPILQSRCSRTHVRRLNIDDICSICYDDEDDVSECDASELVWCKSGCGRSVHKDCFEVWQRECIRGGRAATCIHCRGEWEDVCEC